MNVPTIGITADLIREAMPPYELSTDLLDAMFAATRAPPPDASVAWGEERARRLILEVTGYMPADAPQARIAAQLVIVRQATDDTFALADAPGLAMEHVSRLRRTAGALITAGLALERSLVRHQQRPVPFFGTVLADGIDVAALAGRWGGLGVRRDGPEVSVGDEPRSEPGTDPCYENRKDILHLPPFGEFSSSVAHRPAMRGVSPASGRGVQWQSATRTL